jgi:ABC-type methionine transport system ATPase subunit
LCYNHINQRGLDFNGPLTELFEEAHMAHQVVRLTYPEHLLSVPVINQLIRHFDLTVNILRAQIGGTDRWLEVQLAGDPGIIEEAIGWLENQGIEIQY